jgi:single-strand DNA-binding protein
MINQWIGIGNVTKDFELKEINENTKIANFRIAVNDRKDDNNTLFISIVAFNKLAELAVDFLEKGSTVGVVGRLQIKQKDDRQYTEVVAEKLEFIKTKNLTPQDFSV